MNPSRMLRWTAVLGVLGTAGALGLEHARLVLAPAVVHAASSTSSYDSDGDGLPDEVEDFLGTLPDQADSDGDGFQDGEEFARHSDPLDMGSVPQSEQVGVAMAIYQEGNKIRPVIAVYAKDGNPRGVNLTFGVRVYSSLRNLPLSFISKQAKISTAPTINSTASIMVFDGTMNANYVKRFGSLSLYATGSYRGSVITADALNLFDVGGVIVSSFNSGSQMSGSFTTGSLSNGAYKPLGGSVTPPPSSWSSGQVCSQTMATAGISGAVVTQEVVSAKCSSGWDSYCSGPACSATVGSTIQIIDPVGLLGG